MRNAEVIRQWKILKRIEAGRYTTSQDLADGVVQLGSGDLVLFAAIGAGVHYGAQLVRL